MAAASLSYAPTLAGNSKYVATAKEDKSVVSSRKPWLGTAVRMPSRRNNYVLAAAHLYHHHHHKQNRPLQRRCLENFVGVGVGSFMSVSATTPRKQQRQQKRGMLTVTAVFDRFTDKAIKVIVPAQEESRRLGHNFVGTEQLLLGLISEGTGIPANVLKSGGLDLKTCRAEVEKIIGRGADNVPVGDPFHR